MSLAEIMNELLKLRPEERHLLSERIDLIEANRVTFTQEMFSAIVSGIESAEKDPLVSMEEIRQLIPIWANTK